MADHDNKSKIELVRDLPEDLREQFLNSLSPSQLFNLPYDWFLHGRPKQLEGLLNENWYVWLVMAGRGYGKTRVASETVRYFVENNIYGRIALIGDTAADVRDVIVEGESGIIAKSHPNFRPTYNPSQRKLQWPNGAVAHTYSAEAYETLRGPQHDFGVIDELAKMRYQQEVWDQYLFGLRLGKNPRTLITTTPRPTKLIKEIAADKDTLITTGSTFENSSNLPKAALDQLKQRYEGTRIGRQELFAEILTDNPSALFKYENINDNRVYELPNLSRIVVGVDPAGSTSKTSDETGIVVCGRGVDNHGYVIEDLTIKGSPNEWARVVIDCYHKYKAYEIVAETNYGGDMVINTIKNLDGRVNVTKITSSKSKALRAEPVSVLYEQNKIHHYRVLSDLENEMTQFDPTLGRQQKSPNRLDAMVFCFTSLFTLNKPLPGIC